MEKEKREGSKKCVYCGNFQGYYTKGLCHYDRTKHGYCCKQGKLVNNHDTCESWKTQSRQFMMRKKVATRALYEILMDISAIRQIFEESREEERNL